METRILPALIMMLGDEPFDSVRSIFNNMRRVYATYHSNSFEHIALEEIEVFIPNFESGQPTLRIEIAHSTMDFYDTDKLVLSFSRSDWDTDIVAAREKIYNFIHQKSIHA
jgi:hypothetical protein